MRRIHPLRLACLPLAAGLWGNPAAAQSQNIPSPAGSQAALGTGGCDSTWVCQPVPTGPTGPQQPISVTLTGINLNVDFYSLMLSHGWDGVSALNGLVTVAPGAIVGGGTAASYSMTVSAAFPAGSTLTLVNNGVIAGAGGNGADATSWTRPSNGAPGGNALSVNYALAIVNNGKILGGGGGGGAGTLVPGGAWGTGGGGGGGAGYPQGAGGLTMSGNGRSSSNCTKGWSGTSMSGGRGGESYSNSGNGGWPMILGGKPGVRGMEGADYEGQNWTGGGGGGAGASGGSVPNISCQRCPAGPMNSLGGAPGYAVVGNANVTWSGNGMRVGRIR